MDSDDVQTSAQLLTSLEADQQEKVQKLQKMIDQGDKAAIEYFTEHNMPVDRKVYDVATLYAAEHNKGECVEVLTLYTSRRINRIAHQMLHS